MLKRGLTAEGPLQKRFFKRLLAGLKFRPRRIVTDPLWWQSKAVSASR
jgi:transposase-like protein